MNMETAGDATLSRARLKAMPDLGMGNFFWKCLEVYPEDGKRLIPARPFETAWGEKVVEPSLGDLGRIAERYARCFRGLGIGPRDPVGVYGDFGATYFLYFLALTRIGAVPVFANDRMATQVAGDYLSFTSVRYVLTDPERLPAVRAALSGRDMRVIADPEIRAADEARLTAFEHGSHDPVLITHSSGTTGPPKAVTSLHDPYFYFMRQSLDRPRDPATRRTVSALPPAHNSAIGAIALALINNEEIILAPEQDAETVVDAVNAFKASCVTAFPQTYVEIVDADPDPERLETVEMWINLGDAAHEAHIRPLMRYGHHRIGRSERSGSRFVDGLGSSEMGSMLFTMVHRPGTPRFDRCIGKPNPWVEARILDRDGGPVPDGRPGLLAVKSPGLFAGYWNNDELTERSFRDGRFLTGDVVRRDEQGWFYHLDRVTDWVVAGDEPVCTLVYEEAILNGVEALLDCCVVADTTAEGDLRMACVAVRRRDRHVDEAEIVDAIDAALRHASLRSMDRVRLASMAEVPVGVTGKVLKRALRDDLFSAFEPDAAGEPRSSSPDHASVHPGHPVAEGDKVRTEVVRGDWSGGFNGKGHVKMGDVSHVVSAARGRSGPDGGTSPSSLLVAAASGCFVLTLATVLEQRRLDVKVISIESEGLFEGSAPPELVAIVHRPTVSLVTGSMSEVAEVRKCFTAAKTMCLATRAMPTVNVSVEGATEVIRPRAETTTRASGA